MSTLKQYASLVKLSHTIFAMPFALIAYTYALYSTNTSFSAILLIQTLLCMVLARNTAMGFNRWADRKIDAQNPRTANREIPSGVIKAKSAIIFTILNAIAFIICAGTINQLSLILSPIAIFLICGYSYTKRFTSLSHVVLGVALAIAPIGAYIAVVGDVYSVYFITPVLLAGLVISWTAGIDILYSLQDTDFDRSNSLHSIPAKLGVKGAVATSIIAHCITIFTVWLMLPYIDGGTLYKIGATLFTLLLIFQHIYFTPKRVKNIGATFGLINGTASICYSIFAIADIIS